MTNKEQGDRQKSVILSEAKNLLLFFASKIYSRSFASLRMTSTEQNDKQGTG